MGALIPKPPRNRYERELLVARLAIFERALMETGGNITAATRLLGVVRYLPYRWYQAARRPLRGRGASRGHS